jgi:Phosphotransferase enzyme family
MKVDWHSFFPSGERVLALPNWQNPRLYLPVQSFIQRWEGSSLYPAFRFQARLYRSLLRIRTATGLVATRMAQSRAYWPLGEFTQDMLPQVRTSAVLVGASGLSQKITVQLQDKKGRVAGYLKYAEKDLARERLRQEREILSGIPSGLGPEPLKYGAMGNGDALLITPLEGRRLPAALPPAGGVVEFLSSLTVLPPVSIEDHPWVRRAQEQNEPELDSCFEAISGKNWPVMIQHGDFAPWNLLRRPDDSIGAIDWEWGSLEGLPYLDLIYYILLTSALIYRWAPLKAAKYAAGYLAQQPQLGLNTIEARVLTRLAAYDVYQRYQRVRQTPANSLQMWWGTVWESKAWSV